MSYQLEQVLQALRDGGKQSLSEVADRVHYPDWRVLKHIIEARMEGYSIDVRPGPPTTYELHEESK